MQSLKKRLEGEKEHVIKLAETYGRGKAMDDYGIHDLGAWFRWAREEAGDENLGAIPKVGRLNIGGHRDPIDHFLEKFTDYVERLKARVAEQDRIIKLQELQLKHLRQDRGDKLKLGMLKTLESCQ